jgi:hypothetical protein
VKVTVPRAELPVVGSRLATAEGLLDIPMEAQPAAAMATAVAMSIRFMV